MTTETDLNVDLSHLDTLEKATALSEIVTANIECTKAEQAMIRANEIYKDAKKNFEALDKELRNVINRWTTPEPLFDDAPRQPFGEADND